MTMRRYKSKYFELYELLPPELYKVDYYESESARELGYGLIDEKLLITIDIIREDIVKAPLICNTWYINGTIKNAGVRSSNCTVGASNSQHKLGKAIDLVCHYYSAEEMRQMLEKNKHLLPFPIRVERNVDWLHIDVKDMDYKGKKIVYF